MSFKGKQLPLIHHFPASEPIQMQRQS